MFMVVRSVAYAFDRRSMYPACSSLARERATVAVPAPVASARSWMEIVISYWSSAFNAQYVYTLMADPGKLESPAARRILWIGTGILGSQFRPTDFAVIEKRQPNIITRLPISRHWVILWHDVWMFGIISPGGAAD